MEYLPFLRYANLYPKKKLSKYVYDFMLYILQPVDVCPEAPIIRKWKYNVTYFKTEFIW